MPKAQLAARHSRASLCLGVRLSRALRCSTTTLCWPDPPACTQGPGFWRAVEPQTLGTWLGQPCFAWWLL